MSRNDAGYLGSSSANSDLRWPRCQDAGCPSSRRPAHAGRFYWIFGSLTGTTPGIPIGSVVLPLNYDVYSTYTITHPNQVPLVKSLSVLDGSGHASAAFVLPAGANPILVGLTVHHAYLLGPSVDFASNPLALTFVP